MVDMMTILIGDVCEDSVREKWSKAESSFSSLKCLRCDTDVLLSLWLWCNWNKIPVSWNCLWFYGNDEIISRLIVLAGSVYSQMALSWAIHCTVPALLGAVPKSQWNEFFRSTGIFYSAVALHHNISLLIMDWTMIPSLFFSRKEMKEEKEESKEDENGVRRRRWKRTRRWGRRRGRK